MSFVKLQPENFDNFSLTLRPRTEFISSSLGVVGSARLVERPSATRKAKINFISATTYTEEDFDTTLREAAARSGVDKNALLTQYLDDVNQAQEEQRNNIVVPITRITQSIDFDRNSFTKSLIKNVLMPQYRSVYTDCDYSYKNYHTINFFTASTVPSDSAIIYPNISGLYNLTSSFSVDFYINPRYLADVGTAFNAGTILHVSSSICLSLLTGSHTNANNQTDKFRLALGLKHSANISPSLINATQANGSRTYPQDLIYVTDDNLLSHNHWHHVTVKWDANGNNRSGSFQIDAITSSFYYPSSSINVGNQNTVILGNFYSGSESTSKFFNLDSFQHEGTVSDLTGGSSDPTNFTFNNPLNAEIHDFKIFNRSIKNSEILKFRSQAPDLNTSNLIFYVPPFFTNNTVLSQDEFAEPTLKIGSKTPRSPFNINLAFASQIFAPSTQNFLFDVKNGTAPRLYRLTASLDTTELDEYAVDHMFRDRAFIKNAYTILPCDNGLFAPNFDFVPSSSTATSYRPYQDDKVTFDATLISLRDIDTNTDLSTTLGMQTVGLIRRENFISPTEYKLPFTPATLASSLAGNLTTLLSFSGSTGQFADTTSNLSTIYQISNLYYGNQIFPESFEISSTALTGSGGKINITLKDNGFGGLYRADAVTPAPRWATIGNLFYDEGLAIIKTPHLYYFGKDNFSVSFNGHQNIHTYAIDAICPAGEINSSSNPSYLSFPPTNEQNETADSFVYITGINIHDDNFNVIMRANLAQPVLKRPDEEFLFRLKYDM